MASTGKRVRICHFNDIYNAEASPRFITALHQEQVRAITLPIPLL